MRAGAATNAARLEIPLQAGRHIGAAIGHLIWTHEDTEPQALWLPHVTLDAGTASYAISRSRDGLPEAWTRPIRTSRQAPHTDYAARSRPDGVCAHTDQRLHRMPRWAP